jgi:transposase InsO family protein
MRPPSRSRRCRPAGDAGGSPRAATAVGGSCDFLTVDAVWLRRLHVLVFLSIGNRRIEYLACTSNPDTAWMLQQARHLLMDIDERGRQARFLLDDRDTKFAAAFDAVFDSTGIRIIRTPVRAPNANAHVERWVGSIRRECLEKAAGQAVTPERTGPGQRDTRTTRASEHENSGSRGRVCEPYGLGRSGGKRLGFQ